MKYARLVKLAHAALGDELKLLGFKTYEHGFVRTLPSLVRQSVSFGLDSYKNDIFWIRCCLNSPVLDANWPGGGWFFVEYLRPDGKWDCNPGTWTCRDDDSAIESLTKINGLIETHIKPWLGAFETLSQFANALRDPNRGFCKGTLFFHDNNLSMAAETLNEYRFRLLAFLRKPPDYLGEEEIKNEIAKVDAMLAEVDKRWPK